MKINGKNFRTIWHKFGAESDAKNAVVEIIDQTLLPHAFEMKRIGSLEAMVTAIKTMQVRGAPLIGVAAAYGMVLALQKDTGDAHLSRAAKELLASRTTAVNLRWAVERMLAHLQPLAASARLNAAWAEAAAICEEEVVLSQAIGQHGLRLIQGLVPQSKRPLNILTHCNAGWLSTVDWGTALSPIYAAHDAGLAVHVWVDETRPRNQGASLTAWELGQHGVPHTVITDNAGGHLMQHGQVDLVIVGADRVTRTGDVGNKIGTYLKALAAFDNHVPFYAALPSTTIDWTITNGLREIPIEERSANEVALITGRLPNGKLATVNILPQGSLAANPAFDVTPARFITGIITERGVCASDQLNALFPEKAEGSR